MVETVAFPLEASAGALGRMARGMDPAHLEELARIERSYWWTVAKSELVTQLLSRHAPPPGMLVEGGIGAGSNLARFRALGYETLGLDASAQAVAHCERNGQHVRVHDLQAPWPVSQGSVDVVVLLDVIEHLHDPVAALRHAAHALRAGGTLVLTVPALPALMGPWDRMLGHLRRYTTRQLSREVADAGLTLTWLSYWNAFSLAPAILVRLRERLWSSPRSAEFPPVPAAVNQSLKALAAAERSVMKVAPIPLGVSLVGVLTR